MKFYLIGLCFVKSEVYSTARVCNSKCMLHAYTVITDCIRLNGRERIYERFPAKEFYSEQLGKRVLNFINALMAYSRVTTMLSDEFKIFSKMITISLSVT